MDAAFGRILGKLSELGLDRNTIVIFTSDHGDMAGRHGLFEKSVMYEEAVRVPLVIRVPDGPGNAVCDSLFSTVDFLHTLLELCGLPPHEGAEGISYARAIRGERQTAERKAVYMSHYENGQAGHCIRFGPLKFMTNLSATEPLALFDLNQDPYEDHNLLAQPGHEEMAHQLQDRIRQWQQDTLQRAGDPAEAAEMSPWFKERMA